ncbi:FAD-dependent monooxygenase [Streptomyces sp. MAR4 CNX-425]|uniref:FAD-dependent monooxygenase n=1 Tax=Streptomyces sp. MAR4 CNX-425 TaxID=3406343 RepID=UPI003B512FD8
MTTLEAPVGIVGAGPVGLVAALRLAGLGVPSVVVDAKPSLVKQGSKACLIQGDVLEVLDKAGCADPVDAEGVTWRTARTYVANEQIRSVTHPKPLGYGPFVNISQYRIEQVLAERAAADPLVDLRWDHRVEDVTQDAAGVTLTTRTGAAEQILRVRHLVACDGVRSTLRELLGVEWTGYTHKDRFLITDIRAKLPLAKERHFHYNPSFNPGRQLVMHPQPDDIWRIDWQLPPDADIDAERADGRFDARVRAVIGDIPYEVDWVSTYRFHQRVVARLRVGRVLFAGDAAHALPPYGSRGMNSGIQDADNLAWKLAQIERGLAGEELLESYHTERYAAARENLRITEATIRFMVPPHPLRRWARAVLLRLSKVLPAAERRVNSGRMAEPFVYRDSPLIPGAAGDPLLGHFAPDAPLAGDGGPDRLRRLFGHSFVGLLVAPDAAGAARLAAAARSRPWAVAADLVAVLPAGAPAEGLPDGVRAVHTGPEGLPAGYAGDTPGWWLVRPDGHLAARSTRGDDFAAALATAAGSPAEDGTEDGTAEGPEGDGRAAAAPLKGAQA